MSTPSTPKAPPAPLTAAAFEENVQKVSDLMEIQRKIHICGVGYSFEQIAEKIGVSVEYVRVNAPEIVKRLCLEIWNGGIFIPDNGPDQEDRLFEAVFEGTVDGEAFDGDPADLW